MKIKRPHKVREQIELAKGLKAEIVRIIRRKLHRAKLDENKAADWHRLLREVELCGESFKLTLEDCSAKQVDRRKSMLTGPFFISDEFPIPAAVVGMMFPVLQLELNEASAAIQDNLGDGLLQLWYDLESQNEYIRVIPLTQVYAQEMMAFNWVPPASVVDFFPLPSYWNTDPCGDMVQQITGLTSEGFQCHEGSVAACCDDVVEDESDWLWVLMKLFFKNTPHKSTENVSLFGALYPIQYSAADVDMNCLIRIADWGSEGGAQIFYKTNKKEDTQFAFWSCVR